MVFSFFDRGHKRVGSDGSSTDSVEEVYSLVSTDKKIQAIKVLRGVTGWGLKEAKDVVDRIGRGEAVPELNQYGAHPSTPPSDSPGVVHEGAVSPEVARTIRDLIAAGKKIQAVKELRGATGWSLGDAKHAVDRLESGQSVPELDGFTPAVAQASSHGGLVPYEVALEVRALTDAGRKANATRVLREATGWNLRESKAVVDRVAAGDDIPEFDGPTTDLASVTPDRTVVAPEHGDQVRELVAAGRHADAIARLRESTGWSVHEAEDVVDRLVTGHEVPELVPESVATRTRATLAEIGREEALTLLVRETGMTPEQASRFLETL